MTEVINVDRLSVLDPSEMQAEASPAQKTANKQTACQRTVVIDRLLQTLFVPI